VTIKERIIGTLRISCIESEEEGVVEAKESIVEAI
jgi:hypothetical protein